MKIIISTHEAARQLGIHFTTLAQYIAKGKLPSPAVVQIGSRNIHSWTQEEVEKARKLLPKIANGRKIRYQKQKGRNQKPQPKPVPHKSKQSAISTPHSAKAKSKTKKKT